MLACGTAAGPLPTGARTRRAVAGGNPDARGPDLPKRNRGLRDRARRPPVLPRPPTRQRHELSYGAHPEATQGACGAVACVRAVGPFERRTARSRGVATHTPAARSSRWVSYTTRGSSLHSSRETDSTCEGTGGASVGARRTGRRGASARHSAVRWVCRHGVVLGEREREGVGRRLLTRSLQASQERGGKKRSKQDRK